MRFPGLGLDSLLQETTLELWLREGITHLEFVVMQLNIFVLWVFTSTDSTISGFGWGLETKKKNGVKLKISLHILALFIFADFLNSCHVSC